MAESTNGVPLLTIPSVTVSVHGRAMLLALSPNAETLQTEIPKRFASDWRALRNRLFDLDPESTSDFGAWLSDCGYIPLGGGGWTAENLTPSIRSKFTEARYALRFLMSLTPAEFRRLVIQAREKYEMRDGPIGVAFKHALALPDAIGPQVIFRLLTGAGNAPNVSALLHWDRFGRATVSVHAEDPIEALGISVRIDKEFSTRQWVNCGGCGKGFERDKTTDKYCSNRCKNAGVTRDRRAKLQCVNSANAAWLTLPMKERTGDRWKWIAKRVRELHKIEVDPKWARTEISKLRSKR